MKLEVSLATVVLPKMGEDSIAFLLALLMLALSMDIGHGKLNTGRRGIQSCGEEGSAPLLFGSFSDKKISPGCVSRGHADAHSANAESLLPE